MTSHYRDTTVQTLTLQPNVQDGVIVYEDSPLVSKTVITVSIKIYNLLCNRKG